MLKILKDNLPWAAPTGAIVLFGTGFFDRFKDDAPAQTAIPVAALPTPAPAVVLEPVVEVAQALAAAFVGPEPAPVVLAVADPDPSTAARLAA